MSDTDPLEVMIQLISKDTDDLMETTRQWKKVKKVKAINLKGEAKSCKRK